MDMERQDNKALLAEELLAVSRFQKNLYFSIKFTFHVSSKMKW